MHLRSRLLGLSLAFALIFSLQTASAADLTRLPALGDQYPRAYFFRASESPARNTRISFEQWDATFSRLMGIEGKVLDEEIPGTVGRNIEFFTRFKKQHPDQLVLLHYNGNARDPRYQTEKYFAGHFLYYNGARILGDVPAEEGESQIKVDNPDLFRTGIGRYKWSSDDIGLCVLDAAGKPDWRQSEQVQLVSVDTGRKTIRVRRACYGTRPRAFPARRSYAATHMTEGPWGAKSNLLWFYNYATCCPRDDQGRTCADVHTAELAARFAPDGELAAFDGMEFDVLTHARRGTGGFGSDCDADGKVDNGLIGGVNAYGGGVVEFCRQLRQKMGPDRLIMADGMSVNNQRAFRILNGIESEGWPTLSDWAMRDWSGGLNRHWFWDANSAEPVFNYINHKYVTAGEKPGFQAQPEVPFATHRLVFAAGVFTNSAICYALAPQAEPGRLIGIWDEFRKGTENQLAWLGRPLGPAKRLAMNQADVLESQGNPIQRTFLERISGDGVKASLSGARLVVASKDPAAEETTFVLRGVPCQGPDLFVSVTASGSPREAYAPEIARLMWVGTARPEGQLITAQEPRFGTCVRGGKETDVTPDGGGMFRFLAVDDIGGQRHDAYHVHPPYKGGVGYTYWEREVAVPDKGRLEFYTGMGPKSPERSDGVWFRVLVAEVSAGDAATYQQVFEHSQKAFEWVRHEVALDRWAGRRVRLKFVADCGPKDNATTDHAAWGDAVLFGSEGREAWTPPARFMTWLNDRPFTSGFYFSDIRSKTVDLEFTVEGSEQVCIDSIRAYHHPDVICREFEHGLVLANPAPRPYAFDLARLFPGRHFRRLKGSATQDPAANDGSPIGDKLTLGPVEGLFLVE